jgi:eukaryotic-like serine/threonine-protein kinase
MEPTPPDQAPRQAAAESAPPADAAGRLWQLWRQGQRPDVDAFLAQAGSLSPDEVAATLRVDQRQRWQAGERILAESYLQRHSQVRADPETAVDLVFNEFLVRDQLGERPDAEEYLRRFPEYAGVLGAQIELHRALHSRPPTVATAPRLNGVTPPDGNSAASPARPSSAFVLGGMPSAQELQTLLRRRLWFLSVVSFAYFACRAPILAPFFGGVTVTFLMLATSGSLAALLWRQRSLSLRALRGIELVLFGSNALCTLGLNYGFFRSGWLATLAGHDEFGMVVATRTVSWIWVVPIIVYGIAIPNTWRRCAAVVGGIALTAGFLNLTCGLLEPRVEPHLRAIFCAGFVIDVGLGVVVAVFGAHRLEVLRSAAAEARKLGQYQLKRRLGAGGMGEVYLAEHALLRRPCAVKLIRPERVGDPTSLRRFEREVQVTATLTHPNTVEIFDYGHAADGTFYYVMEHLAGPNLEELVERQGPLPPGRAVHLLRQVCGSLAEAHAAGLIHRDIKPTNIIACQRGGRCDVAKLLDFGLARQLGPDKDSPKLTQDGIITGTPAYMSPEQAAGGDSLDARSDIYSLGAVAYFLLTGQPPFLRATAVQTLAAHLGEPVTAPSRLRPGLPADLEAIVLQCLAKEPAKRFPSVEALERALAGCACTASWSWQESADWWREYAATGGADRPPAGR